MCVKQVPKILDRLQYVWKTTKSLRQSLNGYRLLDVYCEIFGTNSYGEGRTSLRVRLRHMNECRIFRNIHSTTFLILTMLPNTLYPMTGFKIASKRAYMVEQKLTLKIKLQNL